MTEADAVMIGTHTRPAFPQRFSRCLIIRHDVCSSTDIRCPLELIQMKLRCSSSRLHPIKGPSRVTPGAPAGGVRHIEADAFVQ